MSSSGIVEAGITLSPLDREISHKGVSYSTVEVAVEREAGRAVITVKGPQDAGPADMEAFTRLGAEAWMLRAARELDDAILHLRNNEKELGLIAFQTQGDPERVVAHEALLLAHKDHWLANEVLQYWKRVLKRIDVTSRSLVAIVEHGACFAGPLAELLWASDRSYMMLEEFDGDSRPIASLTLTPGNFGSYPMGNDLTRLETRFWGAPNASACSASIA